MIQSIEDEKTSIFPTIVIPTQCFEETVSFYRDVIGLSVHGKGTQGALLSAGNISILVRLVSHDSKLAPTGHGIYLSLIVSDLGQVERRLLTAQNRILERSSDGNLILALDPTSNLVELIGPRSDDSRLVPSYLKSKMLAGYVSQMFVVASWFVRFTGVDKATEGGVHRLGVLHNRLRGMWDYVRQQWGEEPDSMVQGGTEETTYHKLRTELVELGAELCTLAYKMVRTADADRIEEMQKHVELVKEILDNVSTLPD
jgi:hypothetical protein